MDGTPLDELISKLKEADPADAPETADEVAAVLASALENADAESSDA